MVSQKSFHLCTAGKRMKFAAKPIQHHHHHHHHHFIVIRHDRTHTKQKNTVKRQ